MTPLKFGLAIPSIVAYAIITYISNIFLLVFIPEIYGVSHSRLNCLSNYSGPETGVKLVRLRAFAAPHFRLLQRYDLHPSDEDVHHEPGVPALVAQDPSSERAAGAACEPCQSV